MPIAADAIRAEMDGRWSFIGRYVGNVRLTLRGMFEAAIGDGAKKFTLQQKVAETGRVNADVAALLIGAATGDSQVTLLVSITVGSGGGRSGGGRGGLQLLVGVVDKVFLVRHDGDRWKSDRCG